MVVESYLNLPGCVAFPLSIADSAQFTFAVGSIAGMPGAPVSFPLLLKVGAVGILVIPLLISAHQSMDGFVIRIVRYVLPLIVLPTFAGRAD